MMSNKHLQPVLDIYPWPNGLGFRNAEEWWSYVHCQCEENKLELLMTMALLSEQVCQLMLAHDQDLLDRFQFSAQIIEQLCLIHADNLQVFATILLEQNNSIFGDDI